MCQMPKKIGLSYNTLLLIEEYDNHGIYFNNFSLLSYIDLSLFLENPPISKSSLANSPPPLQPNCDTTSQQHNPYHAQALFPSNSTCIVFFKLNIATRFAARSIKEEVRQRNSMMERNDLKLRFLQPLFMS